MKKKVHYLPSPYNIIHLHQSAFIKPLDHPDETHVTNTMFVQTSIVVALLDNGFETQNTIYIERK